MKQKEIVQEIISFYLCLSLFYEGIYKMAYWHNFSAWLHHAPLLQSVTGLLGYVIPVWEIALAVCLLIPATRVRSLYITLVILVVFILWVAIWMFFTKRIYWPFHGLWSPATWKEKILISLLNSWLAFTAILIIKLRKPSAGQQIAENLDPRPNSR